MKNKDIIKLLKKKANDIDIPDMTKAILHEVGRIPIRETVERTHRSWFRPILRTSLAVMALVLVFVLFKTTDTQSTLAMKEETIALSSVMSASLANDVFADSIALTSDNGEVVASNRIDDELEGLGDYFHLMEHFFSSDPTFEVRDAGSAVSYEKHMHFFSLNFLDERTDYDLYYDLFYKDDSMIMLDGVLSTPGGAYFVSARIESDNGVETFIYTIVLDDGYMIESKLVETQGKRSYSIDVIVDETYVQHLAITMETNGSTHVFLQFLNGTQRGTYRFSLNSHRDDLKPGLDIDYAMIIDGGNETGRISVSISESMVPGGWIYNYRVKPRGEDVYHYEKARSMGNV